MLSFKINHYINYWKAEQACNTVNPTDIPIGGLNSAVAKNRVPLNKETLEAVKGPDQTPLLFGYCRSHELVVVRPNGSLLPQRNRKQQNYFANIRPKHN